MVVTSSHLAAGVLGQVLGESFAPSVAGIENLVEGQLKGSSLERWTSYVAVTLLAQASGGIVVAQAGADWVVSLVGGGLPAQNAGLRITLNECSARADGRRSAVGASTCGLAEVEDLSGSVRAVVDSGGVTYGLVASIAETGSQRGVIEDAGAGWGVGLVGGSLPAQAARCQVVSGDSRLKVEWWVTYSVRQTVRPEPVELRTARQGMPTWRSRGPPLPRRDDVYGGIDNNDSMQWVFVAARGRRLSGCGCVMKLVVVEGGKHEHGMNRGTLVNS